MGAEIGRIDCLNWAIMLTLALVRWRTAVLLAPAMIFFHEASAALHLPLLLVLHRRIHGPGREGAATAILSALALALVMLAGRAETDAAVLAAYPGIVAHNSKMLTVDFAANTAFVAERLSGASYRFYSGLALMTAYCAAVLLIGAWRTGAPGVLWRLGVVTAFAPLGLMPVGIDWARWLSAAALNLLILALVFKATAPVPEPRAPAPTWLTVAAMLFGALGPAGVIAPFPMLDQLRDAVWP